MLLDVACICRNLEIQVTSLEPNVHVYVCMDGWMDRCMDGWMDGCTHGCMNEWMDG